MPKDEFLPDSEDVPSLSPVPLWALPAKDNGFSEELQLLEPFKFFEIIHRMAYVNAATLGQRCLSTVHPYP